MKKRERWTDAQQKIDKNKEKIVKIKQGRKDGELQSFDVPILNAA